jgi:5-methylcytosine-specific restriction endonuclease McrBC regulatory subunit McrC
MQKSQETDFLFMWKIFYWNNSHGSIKDRAELIQFLPYSIPTTNRNNLTCQHIFYMLTINKHTTKYTDHLSTVSKHDNSLADLIGNFVPFKFILAIKVLYNNTDVVVK